MKYPQPLFSYKITDTERDRDRDRDRYDIRERDRYDIRDRDRYDIRERDREEENSSRGFDSYRQNDGGLLYKILNAFEKRKIPPISINPEITKSFVIELAKDNIKHSPSENLDVEAIKNIQTSCYILSHPEYSRQRGLAVEYLLETLFTPKFLLKDDYTINENRLAIVGKDGSNFASFLLNSNDGSELFFKFLKSEKFLPEQENKEDVKQRLLESMIFSTPLTKEIDKHRSPIIINHNAFLNFQNSLALIPKENKKSFHINVLRNFALRSAKIKNSSFYVDSVISSIKENYEKEFWAYAINEIFSHPSKEENPIKSAFVCDNDTYLLKVKEFIEEAYKGKTQEKQHFIKNLAKNCGLGELVLERKFESLRDKRVSSTPTNPTIFGPGPSLFRR